MEKQNSEYIRRQMNSLPEDSGCCSCMHPKTRLASPSMTSNDMPMTAEVEEALLGAHSKPIPSKGGCRKNKRLCSSNCSIAALLIMSAISLGMSFAVVPIVDAVINGQVKQTLVVDSPDSPSFDQWKSNTGEDGLDVHYDVYMWDITNPDGILAGEKPVLAQRGPYKYREYFTRQNIVFDKKDHTATYYTTWQYIFDEEASHPLHDSDEVTQANLVMMGLRQQLLDSEDDITKAINDAIDGSSLPKFEKSSLKSKLAEVSVAALGTKAAMCLTSGASFTPFHTMSARDLYFGYSSDPTLAALKAAIAPISPSMASNFSTFAPGLTTNYTSYDDTLRRSNTDTTYTGADDIKKLGRFKYYQNMTHQRVCLAPTPCRGSYPPECTEEPCTCHPHQAEWTEEEASCHGWHSMFATPESNEIRGTDATMTGRIPLDEKYVEVFISDLYRSSELLFQGEVDWDGVTLRRYGIDPKDLLTASELPSQEDFFQWAYDGLENMTNAAGFKLFASKPHFLDGADELLNGVVGVSPNTADHDTFVDFEPITGVAFRAAKRLQIVTVLENWDLPVFSVGAVVKEALKLMGHGDLVDILTCLESDTGIDWSSMVNQTYTPYAWTSESYIYSDEENQDFQDSVYAAQDLGDQASLYFIIAAGGLLACTVWSAGIRGQVRQEEKTKFEAELTKMQEREGHDVEAFGNGAAGGRFGTGVTF